MRDRLFTQLPTRLVFSEIRLSVVYQPVEKADLELIATTDRAQNVPKAACLVAHLGRKRALGESFNSLALTRQLCG